MVHKKKKFKNYFRLILLPYFELLLGKFNILPNLLSMLLNSTNKTYSNERWHLKVLQIFKLNKFGHLIWENDMMNMI